MLITTRYHLSCALLLLLCFVNPNHAFGIHPRGASVSASVKREVSATFDDCLQKTPAMMMKIPSTLIPKSLIRNFIAMPFFLLSIAAGPVFANDANDLLGASSGANAKITTGGASTLQSGRTIAITRGVNLDRANFEGQDLKGVAFQQSIVRDANFKGANLVGSSFFDATVDGSNFENADMSNANIEMAQFRRANLRNTILREMYVSGATLLEGVEDIENSDWTDTFLRKDQQKYLCEHPTAKGTNTVTGVDTRESLMCKD